MSDVAQGQGWWLATDGKWYAPEQHPNYLQPQATSVIDPTQVVPPVGMQPENVKRRNYKVMAIIGAAVVVLLIILIAVGSGGSHSSSGSGSSSGVNTQSAAYRDGYSTGTGLVFPGSAITVQDQCDDYYLAANYRDKAEWVAGCVAGGNQSGNG